MKNLVNIKLMATIAVLFVAGMNLFAQSNYTKVGTYAAVPDAAGEVTDTVAVGARMPYYVAPDATIDAAITAGFMNKSKFKWVLSSGTVLKYDGTATAADGSGYYDENEISVLWSSTGSFTVKTTEKSQPKTGSGCEGGEVSRDVVVQALPGFAFPATKTTGACAGGVTSFDLPVTLSGSGPWKISYTITKGATTEAITDQVVTNGNMPYTGSITTLTLPVDLTTGALDGSAGTYTVTVTKITDRITAKALNALAGNVDAANKVFTIGIISAPTTSPIQHIKNI